MVFKSESFEYSNNNNLPSELSGPVFAGVLKEGDHHGCYEATHQDVKYSSHVAQRQWAFGRRTSLLGDDDDIIVVVIVANMINNIIITMSVNVIIIITAFFICVHRWAFYGWCHPSAQVINRLPWNPHHPLPFIPDSSLTFDGLSINSALRMLTFTATPTWICPAWVLNPTPSRHCSD